MRKLFFFLIVIASFALTGCSNFVTRRTLLRQNDSLYTAIANKADTLAMIKGSFELIMNTFDSIYNQQAIFFLPSESNPSGSFGKRELDSFQELVDRQKARIDSLELSLLNEDMHVSSLSRMIAFLRDDIGAKEAEISRMRQEIAAGRKQVAKLHHEVQRMNDEVESMNETINQLAVEKELQQNAIVERDMALNEAYVYVASQKEMMKSGITTVFKKDLSKIDLSKAQKVDIREFTEIEIPTKNPKVLSSMPASSYSMEKNSNSCILRITNPAEFWSQSKILIIQYVKL